MLRTEPLVRKLRAIGKITKFAKTNWAHISQFRDHVSDICKLAITVVHDVYSEGFIQQTLQIEIFAVSLVPHTVKQLAEGGIGRRFERILHRDDGGVTVQISPVCY